MFCCALLYIHSSFAIILMGKRELVALLSLPSWRFMIVAMLFLMVPLVCLHFVIVVFPGHIHYFSTKELYLYMEVVTCDPQYIQFIAKALIRLWVCSGWSEPLLVAHTTLLEISC